MNSQITGLRVASAIFGVMSFAQLLRVFIRLEVLVEGYAVPLWPSVVACVILAGLSFWMWKLTRSQAK